MASIFIDRLRFPASRHRSNQAGGDPGNSDLAQQELARFEKKVTTKVLPNGLTVLLIERPEAPVFSYYTLVDAGDANDPTGESGLAHMFEHLAFKGTEEIGTTNWPAEKVALKKVEETYAAYDAEYRKRVGQDPAKLKQLRDAFDAAKKDAQQYVVPNQFTEIAEENGAHGHQRIDRPRLDRIFLEHAGEPARALGISGERPHRPSRSARVLQRARRGDGRAAHAHRLQSRSGGWWSSSWRPRMSRIPMDAPAWAGSRSCRRSTRRRPRPSTRSTTSPSNIVIAVAGDLNAATAMPIMEKYFGAIPAGPKPEPMTTVEPKQNAEKSVIIREATQPFYIEGYHRSDYLDPDDQVYDAITDILSNGRVSRLYRSLVRDQRIAAEAEGFSGFPGDEISGTLRVLCRAIPGHTPQEMRDRDP